MPITNTIEDRVRLTSFAPVTATTLFPLDYPVYGADSLTALKDDLLVYQNGVLTTGFTVTATFLNGVALNPVVVFASPGITGTLEVYSRRAPRTSINVASGRGMTSEELQSAFNGILASLRDIYDRNVVLEITDLAGAQTAIEVGIPDQLLLLQNGVFKLVAPALIRGWTSPEDSEYRVKFDGLSASAAANLVGWNAMIADLNSGAITSIKVPSGVAYLSANPDPITRDFYDIDGGGQGVTALVMPVTSGTNGTFFTIDPALVHPSGNKRAIISRMRLENENYPTLDGTQNSIWLKSGARHILEDIEFQAVAGALKIGNGGTSSGGEFSSLRAIPHSGAGGSCFWHEHGGGKYSRVTCSGSAMGGLSGSTSHRAFLAKPVTYIEDVAGVPTTFAANIDGVMLLGAVFNHPNTGITGPVVEIDCTNGTFVNAVIDNFVFDQSQSNAVKMVIGATPHADAHISIRFGIGRCTSRVTQTDPAVLLQNTGDKLVEVTMAGSWLSAGKQEAVVLEGVAASDQNNFTMKSCMFTHRGADAGFSAVKCGIKGMMLHDSNVEPGATAAVPFDYLATFSANVDEFTICNNNARRALKGVVDTAGLSVNSTPRQLIANNIGPMGLQQSTRKLTTTDATLTTLVAFVLDASRAYSVKANIRGVQSTGALLAVYNVNLAVSRDGTANAVILGTPEINGNLSFASGGLTIDTSNFNLRIRVTGVAATTINWNVTLEAESVGEVA